MSTVRCSGRLEGWGECVFLVGGVCLGGGGFRPNGCLLRGRGVCLGGCLPRAVSAQGGLPGGGNGLSVQGALPSGCLPRRGCLPGGTPPSPPPPPWTEFLTPACENITFSQLMLRAVTNHIKTAHDEHRHVSELLSNKLQEKLWDLKMVKLSVSHLSLRDNCNPQYVIRMIDLIALTPM